MRQSRADIIAKEIEELIFSGEFANGDRLDESGLSKRFGVSRTPVREALQKLVVTGLAKQFPNRGVFVSEPDTLELFEMFEVMAELEAVCGRLAAERVEPDSLSVLHSANRDCLSAVKARDPEAYYMANERFHHLIYRESGNRFLEQEALRLNHRLQPFRRAQLRAPGRMRQSMAEHEAILTALENGAREAASEALRSHVSVQGGTFHQLVAQLRKTGA